jgi:hypothetical protein
MIFNTKKMNMVLVSAALAFGLSSNVFATEPVESCMMGCGGSNPTSGSSLNIFGSAGISGNVNSVFTGDKGSNEATKWGNTDVNIESSLGGFCAGDDCSKTRLNMNLKAAEGGGVASTVDGKTSAADATSQDSGVFTSGVAGSIQSGGEATEFGTQGAAGFANSGMVNATGGTVFSNMKTYGYGETNSNLTTDGNACPTCVDIDGGTSSKANSGMNMTSMATGGKSGQMIGIKNSGLSESATSMNSMFNKSNN